MMGPVVDEFEQRGWEKGLGFCQRRWWCRDTDKCFEGEAELARGEILRKDLPGRDISMILIGSHQFLKTYLEQGVYVEGEMFCREVYALWGYQNREHDAVRGFEYLEEVIVATCCEVGSCGADKELLVCERRQDQGEMLGGVEEIKI